MLDAIVQLGDLFGHLNFVDFVEDRVRRAACERFLEIISEASRHVPVGEKNAHSDIPWRQIADMGNHLRHAYHMVDPEILWAIHSGGELSALKAAVQAMLGDRSPES